MDDVLTSTNAQKVLSFLVQSPGRQFLANEIERGARISRAGVNFSLRKLAKERLVIREKKAKVFLYSIDHNDPVIKQLKVVKCAAYLKPLMGRLKKFCEKMILFGSCARGEDSSTSDIDIFILTNCKEEVRGLIKGTGVSRKLQPVIRTPLEFAGMKDREPVFFEEISRGITLWEAKE